MATKTKAKTTVKKADPKIAKFDEIVSLSDALVAEIDNVMATRLTPGQLGQLLGSIVTAYKEQVEKLKQS